MPEELLQRMRDIHYPDAPGWFPPAPGWWLLAALILAALVYAALRFRARQQRRAPYATALRLLDQASQSHSSGELATRDYLDSCNEVLKRLLVHVRQNELAVAASGQQWLEQLDELNGDTQFTQGPGKLLGDLRFAPSPPAETTGLTNLLTGLVGKLQRKDAEPAPMGDASTARIQAND